MTRDDDIERVLDRWFPKVRRRCRPASSMPPWTGSTARPAAGCHSAFPASRVRTGTRGWPPPPRWSWPWWVSARCSRPATRVWGSCRRRRPPHRRYRRPSIRARSRPGGHRSANGRTPTPSTPTPARPTSCSTRGRWPSTTSTIPSRAPGPSPDRTTDWSSGRCPPIPRLSGTGSARRARRGLTA